VRARLCRCWYHLLDGRRLRTRLIPQLGKRSGAAMAGSVNKVILIGNLGADPEIKSFQNGGRIANIRIATSESWKDRMTGERKERTEWHNVVINGDGLVGVVE